MTSKVRPPLLFEPLQKTVSQPAVGSMGPFIETNNRAHVIHRAPSRGYRARLRGPRIRLGTSSSGHRRRGRSGPDALLGLIAYQVVEQASPAIEHFGLSFIWTEAWDPVKDNYGALTFIYGTVVTSVDRAALATPLSIAIALFLTEIAPRRIAAPIATMVELLAAIPSVVLGLWGILVFGPWVAENLEPWLLSAFGFLPLFGDTFYQAGMLRPRSC